MDFVLLILNQPKTAGDGLFMGRPLKNTGTVEGLLNRQETAIQRPFRLNKKTPLAECFGLHSYGIYTIACIADYSFPSTAKNLGFKRCTTRSEDPWVRPNGRDFAPQCGQVAA